jgi:asparagine synthase (glutamine-hydrolysing)
MSAFFGYLGEVPLQFEKVVTDMKHEGMHTYKYIDEDLGVVIGCKNDQKFPVFNSEHNLLAAFKGEIYNKTVLVKKIVEGENSDVLAFSDAELFANLYSRCGYNFLESVRGKFSAAIFDLQTKKLVLFRDIFGETPMYYAFYDSGIVFSTELAAIVGCEEGKREIDEIALGHYLSFGHVPAPRTIFKGVQKLPPACVLQYSPGGNLTISQYWDLASIEECCIKDENVLLTEIYEKIMDCVKIRSSNLGKCGVLLSGGLDSGTIAAFLTKALDGNVEAFSVVYDNPFQNELKNIEKIAEYLNIDYHVKMITSEEINEELIRRIVTLYGEPCANSSVIASYLATNFSSHFVPTLFTGDGGDEAFLGYSILYWKEPRLLNFYSKSSLLKNIGSRLAKPIFELLAESSRDRKYAIALDFFERKSMSDPDPEVRFIARAMARFFSPEDLRKFGLNSDAYEVAKLILRKACEKGFKNPKLYGIMNLNLIADIYKVERSSHAFSVSTRSPFLDHKFMEFMQSIPTEVRIKNGVTKYLLRKILLSRKMLPREIVKSRSKRGFETPVEDWLKGDLKSLVQSKLLEKPNPIVKALRKKHIEKLISSRSRYRSLKVWNLLILSIWYDVFIGEQ